MQDKHGLLTAPIESTLRTMTIPTIFGMVAILMFNLVDTFFISLLGIDFSEGEPVVVRLGSGDPAPFE